MAKSIADLQKAANDNAAAKGFYRQHEQLVELLTQQGREELLTHYQTIWKLARLMLIVTEVGEAAEAVRKPEVHWNLPEEFADIFIRLADTSEAWGIDLESEVDHKMSINAGRGDMHGKLA